jgi:hypothetical protein
MASAADPRRAVGSRVQTKPHFLTMEAQAHRYLGTAATTTLAPGTVLAVETEPRARTSVDVRWELPRCYLTKIIPIRSVTFLGRPDSNLASSSGDTTTPAPAVAGMADEDAARRQEENQAHIGPECRSTLPQSPPDEPIVVHGFEWHRKPVLVPIGGAVGTEDVVCAFCHRRSSLEGRDAIGGDNRRTPYDHFNAMFPPDALIRIATLTSEKLCEKGKQATTGGEILKFFGIVVLGTRCCVFQIPKE